MIIRKITEKKLLRLLGIYCIFFPIITLIFVCIGMGIGEIYTLNLTLEKEKVEVTKIEYIRDIKKTSSSINYIKDTLETMNKIRAFENKRRELEEISINISENKIQNINNLNKEIEKLNKILLESSEEMKLIIKNEIIYGKKKLFFMHTYKKDNIKSIIKSIVILSNIFGNFLLVWILFIIYGKRREKLR